MPAIGHSPVLVVLTLPPIGRLLTRDGGPDIAAGGQPVGPGRRGQIHAIAVPRSVREGADIVEVRVGWQQRPCEGDEIGADPRRDGDGARDAGGPTGEGATRGVGHVIEIGGPAWSLRVSGSWLVEVGSAGRLKGGGTAEAGSAA